MAKRVGVPKHDNRIIRAKEILGVDDAGLAERLGVHRSTVVRMKTRERITGAAGTLLDQIISGAA